MLRWDVVKLSRLIAEPLFPCLSTLAFGALRPFTPLPCPGSRNKGLLLALRVDYTLRS